MISLEDFLKIEKYEKDLFPHVGNKLIYENLYPFGNEADYEEYQIFLETLDKQSSENYYKDISEEINETNEYLYHITSLKYGLEKTLESFKRKDGIKPEKNQKKSFHYRRVYMLVEDISDNEIFKLGKDLTNSDKFLLIRFNLRKYTKNERRYPKWHIDPNVKDDKGIWTRELMPFAYLEYAIVENNKIGEFKTYKEIKNMNFNL